jgi:hypothetical protein
MQKKEEASISQQINEREKENLRSTRCPGHTGKRSYKKKCVIC